VFLTRKLIFVAALSICAVAVAVFESKVAAWALVVTLLVGFLTAMLADGTDGQDA
jgi:hypothetical protein